MRAAGAATVAAILLLCIAAPAGDAQGKGGELLSLKWAFIRLEEGGQRRVLDFSASPVVRAGDQLQVYIEPLTRMHAYLFLFDSRRDLSLLHPPDPRSPPAQAGQGGVTLPGDEQFFTIDEKTGEEQFFLLASAIRLSRLEDLTAAWLKKPGSAEAKARVLEEIKEQRRRHSSLTAAVEKGVPMAGTFQSRAIRPDVLGEATLVEASEFYARTLRLVHE